MKPRVITRTHYQVDEPAYLGVLIRDCSTPTRSEYSQRVAQRLETAMKASGRDFNLAAAKYCVDLGRSLNLLSENNFWTWSAQTLRLIMPPQTNELCSDLSTEEKIFYFRRFLEFDGAALIFLAQKAIGATIIPRKDEEDWNDIADEMMKFIFKSYLGIASDVRDRAGIRQSLSKRERSPYTGKSGSHQCFLHLNVLARVGLLEARNREYKKPAPASIAAGMLRRFVDSVPDMMTLETIAAKGRWPEILQSTFGIANPSSDAWTDAEILHVSRGMYESVIATGATLCPLNTLIEAIQIRQLAASKKPPSREDCLKVYRTAQKQSPSAIRFQVDRMGSPAFISFS
jgi:hypothetical protein